jgi:uncharacterized protein
MVDDTNDAPPQRPESLLPYDLWTEDAMRYVVLWALNYASKNGLPGEHHFFISFRTDQRGVVIPDRLRAQYPQEMTIVLQHQFWDLKVDEPEAHFSVGLSFGSVPATLTVPFAALTGFADPHVQFGMRFTHKEDTAANDAAASAPEAETAESQGEPGEEPQVVSLDAFRKRTPSKDQPA